MQSIYFIGSNTTLYSIKSTEKTMFLFAKREKINLLLGASQFLNSIDKKVGGKIYGA